MTINIIVPPVCIIVYEEIRIQGMVSDNIFKVSAKQMSTTLSKYWQRLVNTNKVNSRSCLAFLLHATKT